METPGYLAAIAACRRWMISACSAGVGPLDFEDRGPAEHAGLFGEVRDAIVDEVRADVEKHEQKRHAAKR